MLTRLVTTVPINCGFCGGVFEINPIYARKRLSKKPDCRFYCSPACNNKSRLTNVPLTCNACGEQFYCSVSQQVLRNRQTCSKKCKGILMQTKKLGANKRRNGVKHRLQVVVNLYARLRDCGGKDGYAACISCNTVYPFTKLDGGHFISTTSSATRYDERNVNAQCWKCNRYLSGNERHYTKGMVSKYGQQVIDELEAQEFTIKKWTLEELLELERLYKDKIKALDL